MKFNWSVESGEQNCPVCDNDFFYDCIDILATCPNCEHEFFPMEDIR